ncbi:hypothetical protein B2G88_06640 [Natronolimnobius baerhuensis]|uniref:Uncharacterized protein n=1 Tax=Natronolimnobius baerhuensis TaxID=253108 RepID=A0A202E767_9EURY|nr:hypothetical protein B2G88_06640 [Natronolimnobius baerhuensis]
MDTDNFGPVLGKLFAASVFAFVLSQIIIILLSLLFPDEADELTTTDLPVLLLIGSYLGAGLSLLCYSGWSFWQVRQMRKEHSGGGHSNPLKSAIYILWILSTNSNDLTAYETRLKRAILTGFLVFLMLVWVPLSIVTGFARRVS